MKRFPALMATLVSFAAVYATSGDDEKFIRREFPSINASVVSPNELYREVAVVENRVKLRKSRTTSKNPGCDLTNLKDSGILKRARREISFGALLMVAKDVFSYSLIGNLIYTAYTIIVNEFETQLQKNMEEFVADLEKKESGTEGPTTSETEDPKSSETEESTISPKPLSPAI